MYLFTQNSSKSFETYGIQLYYFLTEIPREIRKYLEENNIGQFRNQIYFQTESERTLFLLKFGDLIKRTEEMDML